MKLLLVIFMSSLVLVSCKTFNSESSDSDLSFFQGGKGISHGHEELIDIGVWKAHGDISCRRVTGRQCDRRLVDTQRIKESGTIITSRTEVFPFGKGAQVFSTRDIHKAGWKSNNPLILGSLAADFPEAVPGYLPPDKPKTWTTAFHSSMRYAGRTMYQIYCDYYGADYQKIYKEKDADGKLIVKTHCSDLPYRGIAQDVHFLRGFYKKRSQKCGAGYVLTNDRKLCLKTNTATCQDSKRRIEKATAIALQLWLEGSSQGRYLSQFFAGMALHTIHDSFSKAHTTRDDNDPHKIINTCYYLTALDSDDARGACQHKSSGLIVSYDFRDNIWSGAINSTISASRADKESWRNYSKLKPEAQLAVEATRAYLDMFASLTESVDSRTKSSLSTVLEGATSGESTPFDASVRRALKEQLYSNKARVGEGYFTECSE